MFKALILAALALPLVAAAENDTDTLCQALAGKAARNAFAIGQGKECEVKPPANGLTVLASDLKPLAAIDDSRLERYHVYVAQFVIWQVRMQHYVDSKGAHKCILLGLDQTALEGVER